ncbi:MAG: copper-binding protein [Gammaproteobacteria bacterium]
MNAQVPEAQLAMVSMGSRVTARVSGWPAEAFPGRILALLPDIDAQTRTGRVRVALDNPKQKLSPGMFVSLDFTADDTAPQLTVPSEAVIMTGERNVVVVARDGGGFDVVEVTVGAEVDGKTQIVAGLEGSTVGGYFGPILIDSEASLRSTVSRLGAATSNDSHSTASSDSAHRAEGRVTAIDDQGITISHGPVPSLQWPAMTMKFQAAPQTRPAEVTVGTRVSFSFTESGSGAYRIERITALDAAAQGTKSERRP